ncbi:protein XNDC1N isoform X2 [Castor canadensis]|uniref:Protein XNDC1N isoform X2 n=1 Tax=Castor canadensis TaxID=51338 RepID=A0AC58NEU0_CASCN
MAPVKISHVVSFSSQDPKYPVENLLNPDSQRGPWLSCPQDKSGQLKVELQLERTVPISYIDVGNCGCAFLQIDVGRSSWSLDRPFVTLLPATMLMSPTDSKQGKNRSGVRMFKDGDFLAPASEESWDRLRLTCSQPFTRHQSFGLAFLRVRSSLDTLADPVMGPSAPGSSGLSQCSSDPQKSGPTPWLANPSIRRTFFPDLQPSTKEVSELKDILKQLQPGALGRSARMVLSAVHRAPPVSVGSPKNNHTEPGPSHTESTGLCPTPTLSETGEGQQVRGKGNADPRPKTMKSRNMGSAPFVQAPSALRFFPCTLPLVETPPRLTQLPTPPQHLHPHLFCGCPPQRVRHPFPGSSALSASCNSQQEK